jgi:hypothetical protein
VDAASNAAETGIKSNAARMSARDEQVAGIANEQILIAGATDVAAMPISFAAPKTARKKRKPPAKPAPAKIPKKKAAARKTVPKAAPKKAKAKTGRKAGAGKKAVAKKNRAKKAKR